MTQLFLPQQPTHRLHPAALGTGLQYIWLNDNQLSGPIPAALGSLTNLQQLRLHDTN